MAHPSATHLAPRVSLLPENKRDLLDHDPRWCLAQRVAVGSHFSRSTLLSNFLLFIVTETIEGRASEITEHQIGVQVFDRPPHYRTIEDNIVRNYARQLRKRLAEHFAGEGSAESLRIEIPLGGYIPVFLPAAESGSGGQTHAFPVPLRVEIQTEQGSAPAQALSTPRVSSRSQVWYLAGALLVLYSLALVAITWYMTGRVSRLHHSPEAADPLWAALFDGPANTYVVPADAGFNLLEDLSHRPLALADYIQRGYMGLPLGGVDAHSAADLRSQEFTSFVDFQIVAALAKEPKYDPQRVMLRFPRDLRLDDLKNANAVLIGSVGSNPWASIVENSANFSIVYNPEMQGATILNAHPQPGEARSYASHWNEPAHETFALIAFLPNLGGNGHLLLLQGLDVAGTQAAAEALFHPNAIAPILSRASRTDGSLRPFEILLRSTSIESNAAGTQVIGSRIY
ncbi:MAG TPA: hypothetical protein VK716_07560 [Terracidiphilus sp.]|jgi:hypothetical protein|nr:hypothetical protein [Terracidiphilus sp.]